MSRRAGSASIIRTGGGRSSEGSSEPNLKRTLALAGATVVAGAATFYLYKQYKNRQTDKEEKKEEKPDSARNKTVALAVVGAAAVTVAVALKIKKSRNNN